MENQAIGIASACRIELAEGNIKSPCCRRAMLGGLLINAELDGETVRFALDDVVGADGILRLIRQCWSVQGEVAAIRRGAHKSNLFTFRSRKAAEWLDRIRWEGCLQNPCSACASHFARGMFVAGGTLSDPEKSLHLEFNIRAEQSLTIAANMLAQLGTEPKLAHRKNGVGLYYKKSDAIEAVLAEIGATKTVFDFINAKIVREIRNHENRVANCDAGNIQKAVSANRKQLEAIAALRRLGRMDRLDDEQYRTAELREAHPELTLSELGLRMSPPISKSGMYHRMNKIIEIAEAVCAEAE